MMNTLLRSRKHKVPRSETLTLLLTVRVLSSRRYSDGGPVGGVKVSQLPKTLRAAIEFV